MMLEFSVGPHNPSTSFGLRIVPAPCLVSQESVVGTRIDALLKRDHATYSLQVRNLRVSAPVGVAEDLECQSVDCGYL